MPSGNEGLVLLMARLGTTDDRVLAAARATDRADFVPPALVAEAYSDRPVALPERQTTSQPTLIARMIEAAAIAADAHVLEVGTGFGYQTALLGRLARSVISLERFEVLAEAARANLGKTGIRNAQVIVGDGWKGCLEHAPFDAIVVSAAAPEVPEALAEQLAEGGHLVIPVTRGGSDDVLVFVKENGRLTQPKLLTPARFVPLVPGTPT